MMLQAGRIFIRRIDAQNALGADDGVGRDIGGAEAARESCGEATPKTQGREKTFFYFTESRVATIFSSAEYPSSLRPPPLGAPAPREPCR